MWPGTESNYRHEDFQSSCRTETMRHYRSLLVSIQRLTVVSAGRFYRVEHMVPYSSSKVVAKSECQQPSSCCRSHRPTEDQTVLFGSPE